LIFIITGKKFTITEKNLLSLYNSPFKLYEDLANFIKNKNLIISKDWEKAAAILISFNLQKALIEESCSWTASDGTGAAI
jgi:hypothetical protein